MKLTKRELEILRLTANGLTAKEVAAAIFISTKTVEYHLQNAKAKLGAKTKTHAIAKWQMSRGGIDGA